MTRIGKCDCGGELRLGELGFMVYGKPAFNAYCTKCFKEYPVSMEGKSRTYQLTKLGGRNSSQA